MRAIVDGDPDKRALFACLTVLEGVGLVLACTLIANMRELGSLSRHQAAALIGVAPPQPRQRQRRGAGGCAGAQRLVRGNAERGAQQPCDQGILSPAVGQWQTGQMALVACMRKLLVMLNGRVRDQLAVAVIS